MNSTCYCAIKITLYRVTFNFVSLYKRFPINYKDINDSNIEKQTIKDGKKDKTINDNEAQLYVYHNVIQQMV